MTLRQSLQTCEELTDVLSDWRDIRLTLRMNMYERISAESFEMAGSRCSMVISMLKGSVRQVKKSRVLSDMYLPLNGTSPQRPSGDERQS